MAPKDASDTAELIELFKKIGLTQAKAAEAAKSAKSAGTLKSIIETHDLTSKSMDDKQAVLLAALAVQGSRLGDGEQNYAVGAILDGRLKSTDQVGGACARGGRADGPASCWRADGRVCPVSVAWCRGRQVPGWPSASCGRV